MSSDGGGYGVADTVTESLGDSWIHGPCFWEKLEGEGRSSEDSTGFQQDAGGISRSGI